MNRQVVSREAWLEARKAHLEKEKAFTRMRDELSQARRELPWVNVGKTYKFDGPNGQETLSDLFEGCSQLIVYHFMYGPDWEEGCPSCSFWADNYNNTIIHLNHRDISFAVVSRAPLAKLEQYKARMGWTFKWVSSLSSDFNYDYQVSFTPEEIETGQMTYNYGKNAFSSDEAPGISVFYKDEQGDIFHTYSCYSRGLDMLNGTYHHMDLVPKGRDEAELPYSMAWLRRHDQYDG
ncbi:MAG: thioredoxin family protein [Chloroflexota bacterium]